MLQLIMLPLWFMLPQHIMPLWCILPLSLLMLPQHTMPLSLLIMLPHHIMRRKSQHHTLTSMELLMTIPRLTSKLLRHLMLLVLFPDLTPLLSLMVALSM